VPVITLARNESRSRLRSGVLGQVGLDELIAGSEEAYLAKAVELANDISKISEYRNTLRPRLENSSLMNPGLVTASLEGAYRDMWRKWCETR